MKLILAIATLVVSQAVLAQPYIGVGAAMQRQEADGMVQTRNMLSGIAGYSWRYAGVEAFYSQPDYGAGALLRIPMGRTFAGFARVAMHHLSGEIAESTCIRNGGPPSPTTSPMCPGTIIEHNASWSGWAPGIGAGVQFTPGGEGLGVRAMVEKTNGTGLLQSTRSFSMAVMYSF